jgi:hypothetical protein
MAAGASVPVLILGTPTAPGTYATTATVAPAVTDPNPADDSATATLLAKAAPVPPCRVPDLAGVRVGTARSVLVALHCRVGKLHRRHSASIGKGRVIATSPKGSRPRPSGTRVSLMVSSGPAARR